MRTIWRQERKRQPFYYLVLNPELLALIKEARMSGVLLINAFTGEEDWSMFVDQDWAKKAWAEYLNQEA